MVAVAGDVAGMHSVARTLGGHSQTAGAQANTVDAAANQLMPPSVCIGPAADRMRAFASDLHAGMSAVSAAYDRVASMLVRVAHAVDEAKQDEKARTTAESDLNRARQKLAAAQVALAAAQVALAAAQAGNASLAALGLHPGSTAAQQAAVAAARQEVTQAQHEVERANRAYQAAVRRFEAADQRRLQILKAFALLCEEEAAILSQAIPQAPVPNILSFLAIDQLRSDVTSLLDLPVLAASGFAVSHLGAVEGALKTANTTSLDGWANSVYHSLLPAPKPPKHSGGFDLLNPVLFHVGGLSIPSPVGVPYHIIKGVVQGVEGLPAGIYQLGKLMVREGQFQIQNIVNHINNPGAYVGRPFDQGDPLAALINQVGNNPIGFAKAAVGWDTFTKDPLDGIGRLLGSFAAGVGVGKLVDGAGTVAADAGDLAKGQSAALAYGGAQARVAADDLVRMGQPTYATLLRIGALPQEQAARDAWDLSLAFYRGKSGFEHLGTAVGAAGQVAGPVGVLQSTAAGKSEDPYLESLGFDHLGEGLVK